MRRGIWIGLGVLLVLVLVVVAVRIYQDRPQPRRWVVAGGLQRGDQHVPASATSFKITIDSGQCGPQASPLDRIEVDESLDSVTVTAYVDPPGSPLAPQWSSDDCLTFIPGTVELAEPLGVRTLRVGGYENLDPTARELP